MTRPRRPGRPGRATAAALALGLALGSAVYLTLTRRRVTVVVTPSQQPASGGSPATT